VNNTYAWERAQAFAGGTSSDGTPTNCFSGHCDWRLPTVAELRGLLLEPHPCGTSPCIDGVFGLTAVGSYWSSTTFTTNPDAAWEVDFDVGFVAPDGKNSVGNYVRVVRGGL
jgi:hypothetical protein